ncbi:TonB C-terminal domain-containing protein [Sulfurimonas sp.]|uniref:TonB C-terminal domain-containing protein n=1 Tax=Sulfurimonas sp. TaxID=2022749 RepID=UPI0025E09A73|nr:TonB C-terminal domain-containing protein [Sulfurimonas sp.]MDD5156538.1 TonB C-terminal domain-containing protein [Sulfurimonas sp.]
MDRESFYFYASGVLSLLLFFISILFFLVAVNQSSKVEIFALTKNEYISISMETSTDNNVKKEEVAEKEEIVEKSEIKPKEEVAKNSIEEKNNNEVKKEKFDVNDLFSDVKTKKIQKYEEKKEPIQKKNLEIEKKINPSIENKTDSISEKIKTIKAENKNQKSTSSAPEVNEYLAKIQAIVYQHFNPPKNSQGKRVKAIVELNQIGKVLDFRIISYSSNAELNSECDKIKNRLANVVFPENPDNKSGIYTIILISE